MKCPGNIAVCLAGWMALNASLCATDSLAPDAKTLLHKRVMHGGVQAAAPTTAPAPAANPLPDNPYSTIVVRNIFGLIPPAPPPDPTAGKEAGLPKISPCGIMGEFGSWQVLFKVSPAQPGAGLKDEFYTLSEGQRQDDIEVVKIDDVKSIVTFDNHGTTQMLPLSDAPSGGGGGGGLGGGVGPSPGMMPGVSGGGGNGPGGLTRIGAGYAGNNGGTPYGNSGFNNNIGGGAGNGANDGGGGMDFNASTQNRVYQPPASSLSAEEVQILVAAQHLKAIQENSPLAPIFPPTAIDKQAGITPDPGSGSSGPPAP